MLGVSGGIAAYKAVEILRRLTDAGARVLPVLTEAATRFVGVATFSALASEPTRTQLFDPIDPIPHTRLGQRADIVIVAPATARLIGEYACGISADLLGATLLATRAPVIVCPAMHAEMWEHPAVQANVATLRARGVHVVDPEHGRLAGGDVGEGRLADPATIVAAAARVLQGTGVATGRAETLAGTAAAETLAGTAAAETPAGTAAAETRSGTAAGQDFSGLSVLVSAGGTREPIDPVRFIANRSSGRQGHAIAEVVAERGAHVLLVTTAELDAPGGAEVVSVETAQELAEAVLARSDAMDVVIMAAAVADFRPVLVATSKLSKRDGVPELRLEATQDVLAELGRRRGGGHAVSGQVIVGFAAETDEVLERGRSKLVAKGADLVVVNDVSAPYVGFGHTTNAVTMIFASGAVIEVPLAPKREIGVAVADAVLAIRRERALASKGATR